MNAVELRDRIDFYNDLTANARFKFPQYDKAVQDNVRIFIDQICGDKSNRGISESQAIRDNLYTLIKTATPAITVTGTTTTDLGSFTVNHFNNPADYYTLDSLSTLISGISKPAKPTTYGQAMVFMNNIHMQPTNTKVYYHEDATGVVLYRGTGGTFTSVTLSYIKTPAVFTLGKESQRISEGVGVLTIGLSYIALEDGTVQNGVTYNSGTQFTAAATTTLFAGEVILASNTTTIDLPDKVHDRIAKMASDTMLATVSDIQKVQLQGREIQKSN